jgi:hypothetical protein
MCPHILSYQTHLHRKTIYIHVHTYSIRCRYTRLSNPRILKSAGNKHKIIPYTCTFLRPFHCVHNTYILAFRRPTVLPIYIFYIFIYEIYAYTQIQTAERNLKKIYQTKY